MDPFNFKSQKLRTFLLFSRVFQSKFETNRSMGFWVMIGHKNKQRLKFYIRGAPRNMTVHWWIVLNVFFHETVLDIKDVLQFIYYNITAIKYFLLSFFDIKDLTNYGRKHFILFINCHDSWDTLYIDKYRRYQELL